MSKTLGRRLREGELAGVPKGNLWAWEQDTLSFLSKGAEQKSLWSSELQDCRTGKKRKLPSDSLMLQTQTEKTEDARDGAKRGFSRIPSKHSSGLWEACGLGHGLSGTGIKDWTEELKSGTGIQVLTTKLNSVTLRPRECPSTPSLWEEPYSPSPTRW